MSETTTEYHVKNEKNTMAINVEDRAIATLNKIDAAIDKFTEGMEQASKNAQSVNDVLNDYYNAHASMIRELERLVQQEDEIEIVVENIIEISDQRKVKDAIKDVLEALKRSENAIKDALKAL